MTGRKSLMLNVALPKEDAIISDLNELISKIEKNSKELNLKVDIKEFENSFKNITKILSETKKQLSSIGNVGVNFEKISNEADKVRTGIEGVNDNLKVLSNEKIYIDGAKEATKDVTVLKDELGQVIRQMTNLEDGNSLTSVKMDFEKQAKEAEKLEQATDKFNKKLKEMQRVMELLKKENIFYGSVFNAKNNDGLLDKALDFDINTPKGKIETLEKAYKNLTQSAEKVRKLNIEVTGLKDKMAQLKASDNSDMLDPQLINNYTIAIKELDNIREKMRKNRTNVTDTGLKSATENAQKAYKDLENNLKEINVREAEYASIEKQRSNEKIANVKKEADETNRILNEQYRLKQQQEQDYSAMEQKLSTERRKQQRQEAEESNRLLKENWEIQQQFESKKANLQGKLDESLDFRKLIGKADECKAVVNDIQKSLNSLNTDSTEEEIKQVEDAIKNFTLSGNQLKTLGKVLSGAETKMASFSSKYGKILDNEKVKPKVKEFESLMEQIRIALKGALEGKGVNKDALSHLFAQLSISGKELTTEIKTASGVMNLAQKDAVTLGGAFKEMFTKIGLFSIVHESINGLKRALSEGVQSVIDMDTALFDLNKVVDITEQQMRQMRDTAVAMGKELGKSSVEIAQAQAEFGRMYKNLDQINELTKTSTIGANTMGIDSGAVAKGLTTVMSAMKMEASDAMKILDSMNEIQNNYRIESADLLDALSEVGAVAYTSGAELEKVQGYITAIATATGESGSEVGSALKTIMSRVYKIGTEGIESEGKPEEMLKEMGVAVRDAEGEFRDFSLILDDLNIKWQTMSDTQKIATAQTVAGVHRYNSFIALMNNYQTSLDATTTAINSEGSALKENEIYLKSAEAKIGTLKATTEEFMYSLINSDILKGLIDGLTGVVGALTKAEKTFGSLGLTVGVLTTAFLMFTNNPLKKFSKGIVEGNVQLVGFREGLIKTKTSTEVASTGFKALGLQLDLVNLKATLVQATLTAGLSFALTAIIGVVTKVADNFINAKKNLQEFNDEFTSTFSTDNTDNAEKLVENYERLSTQLSELSQDTEEFKEKEAELKEVEEQLAQLYPQSASGIDEQTGSKKVNLELTKELIEQDKLLAQAQALTALDKNKINDGEDAKQIAQNYIEAQNELKRLIDLKNSGTQSVEVGGSFVGGEYIPQVKEVNDLIEEASKNLEFTKSQLNTTTSALGALGDENIAFKGALESINSLLSQNAEKTSEQKSEIEGVTQATYDAKVAQQTLAESTVAYAEMNEEIIKTREYLHAIKEDGYMTVDMISTLSELYPELGSRINDVTAVQDFLNQKLQEQITSSQEAYSTMLMNDTEFYNAKIANNEEFANYFNDYLNSFVSANGEAYNIDLSQYGTLQELKMDLQNQFGESSSQFLNSYIDVLMSAYTFDSTQFANLQSMKEGFVNQLIPSIANWIAQFTGGNAEGYTKDLSNFNTLSEQKSYVLDQLNKKMQKLQSNYNEIVSSINKTGAQMGDPDFVMNGAMVHTLNQIDNLNTAISSVDTTFSGLETTLSRYESSFNASAFKGQDVGKISGGKKTSSGKNPEEEYQKERERLEREANQTISSMRDKLISALRKKYQSLKDKELEVYDKEIEQKQKELDRLRNGYIDETERIAQIENELKQWEKNDSIVAQQKVQELKQQLAEAKLEKEISDLETEREGVVNHYDKLLEEQNLYAEANKLIQTQNYEEMTKLLTNYGEAWKEMAIAMGKDVATVIKEQMEELKKAFEIVKNPSSSGGGSSSSGGGSSSSKAPTKGGKAKIKDIGASIYVSSDTSRSSGTWKGAGVSASESLYVTNMANGRVALGRNSSINSTLGWIDLNKVMGLATGGYTGDFQGGKLGILHKKEQVLSAEQTKSWQKLVENILPWVKSANMEMFKKQKDSFSNMKGSGTIINNQITFENTFNVTNNTDFDTKQFETNVEKNMIKQLLKRGVKMV